MKDKKLCIALIALVAVVGIMAGIMIANRPQPNDPGTSSSTTIPNGSSSSSSTTLYAKTITVTVVHSNGTEKTFTYQTNEQYLGTVLYAEGLILADEANSGMFHTADGEKADWNTDQSYWAFYIGEDYAMTGVDTTPINNGDSFKLVYTRG